jgi:hypothetical protein
LNHGKKYDYLDKHPIGKELVRISNEIDGDGWMASMSEFRNVITHRAPVTQYAGSSFLELVETGAFGEHAVLQIALPLPKDPLSTGKSSLVDALVLMRYYNERMVELSFEIGKLMPCLPKAVELTDKEIVDIQPL